MNTMEKSDTLLPYFSIIIRFYNAEGWIERAILSVINQSFNNWELLLVNDCSSDSSPSIAATYEKKDERIHLFTLETNSGNAKKPGDVGVSRAKGMFCLFLDSDDELEVRYLEKFYVQLDKTKAEIALPIMGKYDMITKKYLGSMPNKPLKNGGVLTGKDACKLTLPTYQIGCNGMAFRTTLYEKVYEMNPYYYMNSDEMSERILLYYADNVVVTDAEYKYWQIGTSITHKLSPKLFEILLVDGQLMSFAKNHYDRALCRLMFATNMSHMLIYQKKYFINKRYFNDQEKAKIKDILQQEFKELQNNMMYAISIKEKLVFICYSCFSFMCYVKVLINVQK